MPEINHKDQPSIPVTVAQQPVPQTVGEAVPVGKTVAPPPVITEDAKLRAGLASSGLTEDKITELIQNILHKNRKAAVEAAKPKEPNWATITERDAYSPGVFIPSIDHEIPDYMNMKLKNPEYEVVWASRDQRRVGQLKAEGYEFLRETDVHPDFKKPLLFDSEGLYLYMDTVAMIVHKRILYGKRRRVINQTHDQIRRTATGLPGNRQENASTAIGSLPKGQTIDFVESIVG
jgi:hypothetical protein